MKVVLFLQKLVLLIKALRDHDKADRMLSGFVY